MKLIVGLGNPGKQYQQTFHNAGALVLDKLNSEWTHAPQSLSAVVGKSGLKIFAKPTTFMNASGVPVQQLLNYYKIAARDLIVVHDDIDLPLGEIRVDTDRSAGGHNGVRSIIKALGGEQDFTRVRVGIATKRTEQKEGRTRDVASIVLKKPRFFDRTAFSNAIEAGAKEVLRAIQ